MQIVIDIDEYTYRKAKNENDYMSIEDRYGTIKGDVYEAIAKGIVLPKGHGRLIDADALMTYCRNQKSRTVDCNDIARFPTKVPRVIAESEE